MELDSISTRTSTTAAEGLSFAELKVTTGSSRKKLYTIRQRPADIKRLAGLQKHTTGKGAPKRLRVRVAGTKIAVTARTAEAAKVAGGGGSVGGGITRAHGHGRRRVGGPGQGVWRWVPKYTRE